ncbi:hypothetical protein [Microbacterium sediminis]|uniref:Uncharacterized protein n=1 Tax=Microbacterium sediminis TaxID=904291 RepID=A0A1B9NGH1_9MICO|nr:hypothetical protein [Microbacterium sediminis]OCG75688.1 hypothetical protein A7J15_01140 [Microbacterium sediminis]QBR74083.1 hypothetical protein E3O41_06395 [Microbacterium sediminis]
MRIYFDEPGGVLSAAELHAAALDGDLVPIGLGWAPADAVETPAVRAAALRPALGDALAAVCLTAAWVHGALDDPPARLHAQRATPFGGRRPSTHAMHVRDALLPAPDQELRGGVRVSTAARTLVDLVAETIARPDRPSPSAPGTIRRAVGALAREADVGAAALRLAATRPRIPHRAELVRRLQEEVTRYTS